HVGRRYLHTFPTRRSSDLLTRPPGRFFMDQIFVGMELLGVSHVEWYGYLASFFVLLSFFMKNITTLRYVNSIGCLFFVTYGIFLDRKSTRLNSSHVKISYP